MRAANTQRIRRRVLQEAVTDNLETIRGLPPRALRPARRLGRLWLKRASLLLVPLSLAGSTYLVSAPSRTSVTAAPPVQIASATRAAVLPAIEQEGAPPSRVQRVAAAAFPLSVRRVIIDAGHGGTDPGATAAIVAEKAITLDIATRLRSLLEPNGFEVVMTRPDDRTVALRDRAHLANGSRGDIFVSIHVNSIVKHTASRGIETYYLGPTDDPSLTALAAAENRVSGYSLADLRKLLDSVYAGVRADESYRLARSVQEQLYGNLRTSDANLENWGVKRAPFVVLVATEMPAILAEVGCLSNEQETAMLTRPEYRQKIAQALFEGIHSYAGASDAPQKKGT